MSKETKKTKQFTDEDDMYIESGPNIIVCGRFAVGKSALIDIAADNDIESGDDEKKVIVANNCVITHTESNTYIEANDFDPEKEHLLDFAARTQEVLLNTLPCDELTRDIHQIWYCVTAGSKLSKAEIKMLKKADPRVVLIATKKDLLSEDALKECEKEYGKIIGEDNLLLTSIDDEWSALTLNFKKLKAALTLMDCNWKKLESIIGTDDEDDEDKVIFGDDFAEDDDDNEDAEAEDETEQAKYAVDDEEICAKDYTPEFIDQAHCRDANYWSERAAKRATEIAVMPKPLEIYALLVENNVKMLQKIAMAYNGEIKGKHVRIWIRRAGDAAVLGETLAEDAPGEEAFRIAVTTYALGQTAKAWFEAGQNLSDEELNTAFEAAMKEGAEKRFTPGKE